MTGLSASADGTVHFIGTTTPSVVYLLMVTVSPAFGSVTLNMSSFWADVLTKHNDRNERVTKRDMVTGWTATMCVKNRKESNWGLNAFRPAAVHCAAH
jgi:hypothetical protein